MWALRRLPIILKHPQLYEVSQKAEGLIGLSLGFLLYKTVLNTKSHSQNVVEVGAYKGASTVYLSLAAHKVGKRVKSFELFSGLPTSDSLLDPGFYPGQYSSELAEYEQQVANYGIRDVVDLVIGDARQTLLPAIENEGFSVAFLDVDVYEVMKELLYQLWSIARGNETIIVHDVNSPGVRKAIDQLHAFSANVILETVVEQGTTSILHIPESTRKPGTSAQ